MAFSGHVWNCEARTVIVRLSEPALLGILNSCALLIPAVRARPSRWISHEGIEGVSRLKCVVLGVHGLHRLILGVHCTATSSVVSRCLSSCHAKTRHVLFD